ncbi:MAG: hypothetical protein ACK5LZ_06085 [Anaerorhabdus sp.]
MKALEKKSYYFRKFKSLPRMYKVTIVIGACEIGTTRFYSFLKGRLDDLSIEECEKIDEYIRKEYKKYVDFK